MNFVNTFLLSIVTKNERYGQGVDSLYKRYQFLSLIYVNILLTILMFLFNVTTELFFNNPCFHLMNLVVFSFSIASFVCLRLKAQKAATIIIVIWLHSTQFICTYNMNLPLVGIFAQLMYPFFIFIISSSIQVHFLNTVLCVHSYYLNSRRFLKIFEITLVDEQFRQVCSLIPTGIFCCFITMGVLTLQKVAEAEIWQLAQENYAKSEFLTKEVVQAMEAKDAFVSMLSHEIRNPLNSLKGSIEYLLQVIKNHEYIQVLKNAKMSGDILLNLVSNVLDAAKLKSDKMEIVCMERI